MSFINERLLESVAYGTSYGAGFKTRVTDLRSGRERRNAEWSAPRGSFSIIYSTLLEEDHDKVLSAFYACLGRLNTFRLQDLTDYKAIDVRLGLGTGGQETYQLQRRYGFGAVEFFARVTKPVLDRVTVFVGGTAAPAVLDYTLGTVTLIAPPGVRVSWSGEFDKVVRFDDDDIQFSLDSRAGGIHAMLSTNVTLQEVFE